MGTAVSQDDLSGISEWEDAPGTECFCGHRDSEEETLQGVAVKGTKSMTLNLEIGPWRESTREAPLENSAFILTGGSRRASPELASPHPHPHPCSDIQGHIVLGLIP